MGDNFNTPAAEESTDTWLTPEHIFKPLGKFDFDPCCPPEMPWRTAESMYYWREGQLSGLDLMWKGRVWLNPPYGRETFKWLDKLSRHAPGGIGLIFARTDTRGFHETIFERAHSIYFFRGRINFWRKVGGLWVAGGAGNAASCLVAYTEADSKIISAANDDGFIIGRQVFL